MTADRSLLQWLTQELYMSMDRIICATTWLIGQVYNRTGADPEGGVGGARPLLFLEQKNINNFI